MTIEFQKSACFSTLLLVVLKEIRLERGWHQGFLAQQIGKSASSFSKMESGQTLLTADAFFGICLGLQVTPAYVSNIATTLMNIFNRNGYFFSAATPLEEDQLLPFVTSYFCSKGYEALKLRPMERISVTALGEFMQQSFVPEPTVVTYCCNEQFRSWIDSGALR